VVKCTGLSHGQGVFLCTNPEELKACIGQFDKSDYHKLALRRFIKGAQHIRVVVIGRQAVDAIKYDQPPDDFRTNAVKVPTASSFPLSEEISALAVSAAQANGVRLAGVDILIGEDGKANVAEVNTPCNFGRNYLTNGKNLADDLIKMLTSSIDK
jgi:ribosomal protein S6--L-glutamate ligase